MDYISEDVDAYEAVDRDIEAYKKQLAEEEARDEAMLKTCKNDTTINMFVATQTIINIGGNNETTNSRTLLTR